MAASSAAAAASSTRRRPRFFNYSHRRLTHDHGNMAPYTVLRLAAIHDPSHTHTHRWTLALLPSTAAAQPAPHLLLLLLALALALLLRRLHSFYAAPRAIAHLRGPPPTHWLLGSYSKREISGGRFTHRVLHDVRTYGRCHGSLLFGRQPQIVVADPELVARVLLHSAYPKVPTSLRFMRRHVGRGLLGEEGEAHARQRKIAAPAFTQSAVNAMHTTIKEKALGLVSRLHRVLDAAGGGGPDTDGVLLNCVGHFNKMALDVIGSVGFGYEFDALREDCTTPLDEAFKALMASMSTGTRYALLRARLGPPVEALGRWFAVPEQVELDRAMRTVQGVSQALVARARVRVGAEGEGPVKEKAEAEHEKGARIARGHAPRTGSLPPTSGVPRDLLSLMVRANVAPGLKPSQRLSDAELRGMVPALLSAGHETASTALSWACHALTQPGHGTEVQRRLRAELLANPAAWSSPPPSSPHDDDSSSSSSSSTPALHRLPYLDAVVREVLRLHSPIRGLRRLVPHDDVLPLAFPLTLADGSTTTRLVVKKGTVLFFSLIAINTDDALWGDGHAFRPERWLEPGHVWHDASHPCADFDAARRTTRTEGGGGGTPTSSASPPLRGVWSSMMTFGMGPTNCIGMRVALAEIKLALAAVLSAFELLPAGGGAEIDYLIQIVAHPVVKGREREGTQVPIRLRRLPEATTVSAPPAAADDVGTTDTAGRSF